MQQHQPQDQISILDEENEAPEDAEEARRLRDIFADMEQKQPDVLDDTAKSVIERIATFLAILFAVTALGNDFPPKYLVKNPPNKWLVISVMACYLLALGAAMVSLQPRNYYDYVHRRKKRAQEWRRLLMHKRRWTSTASILFALGTVALVALIFLIIWPL